MKRGLSGQILRVSWAYPQSLGDRDRQELQVRRAGADTGELERRRRKPRRSVGGIPSSSVPLEVTCRPKHQAHVREVSVSGLQT